MKLKTGDKVRVLAGKNKGKEGNVIQVFPKLGRVVVEGLNMATRHLPKRGKTPGQKISFTSPLHVSNLQAVSGKTGKSGRVGYKIIEREGVRKKIRVLKTKDGSEDLD